MPESAGKCRPDRVNEFTGGSAENESSEYQAGCYRYRKYVNLASEQNGGCHVYVVNGKGEKYLNAAGATGFPFFGELILDCLNRTENAMTQAHAFKAAELCLIAQKNALRIK